MKLLLISLLLVFTCRTRHVSAVKDYTFEFGVNVGHLAFTTSGSIGVLEKTKRISVVVPECTDLQYVRVDINNIFGPPSVNFDWKSRSVIISYAPLQISVSQYTVSAKVVRWASCVPNEALAPSPKQIEFVEVLG